MNIASPRRFLYVLLVGIAALWGSAPGGCRSGGSEGMTRSEEDLEKLRRDMVEKQIEARGVKDPRVLRAMRAVLRHRFVPDDDVASAYEDNPLPIGHDQTISQPYIVALMTELLDLEPGEKVLEVGTGSGYQAAVLAEITDKVFSIEIVPDLAAAALANLRSEGYDSVRVRAGDGYGGWPEEAPFQGIIVTAAPVQVPQPLIDQLDEGGRLVIPVGDVYQDLIVLSKENGVIRRRTVIPVRFVPMTGEADRH